MVLASTFWLVSLNNVEFPEERGSFHQPKDIIVIFPRAAGNDFIEYHKVENILNVLNLWYGQNFHHMYDPCK